MIKKSQQLLENFQNRPKEEISVNSLVSNLFEEVLLIRSAVPSRVLNLITFFSAITVCFQVAIKTVS